MHANHQESTSIKMCDLIDKRVCWNSITKGHLKREGLFLFGFVFKVEWGDICNHFKLISLNRMMFRKHPHHLKF